MGLREVKAERTRAAIIDVGLDLFEAQGYDATTMEQIALKAEVGLSTLYRYFPSKDAILLSDIAASVGALAAALTDRPATEPLEEALGHALHDFLTHAEDVMPHLLRLRAQLDQAPGPRGRLWDVWNQERTLLEQAISQRWGTDADDLGVSIAAHLTATIAEMALDRRRSAVEARSAVEWAHDITALLRQGVSLVPLVPAP